MGMRKSTLFDATLCGKCELTFMVGKKIYILVDVARDIRPTTYTDRATGEVKPTTYQEILYIVRELGKPENYKVWTYEKYGKKPIIIL